MKSNQIGDDQDYDCKSKTCSRSQHAGSKFKERIVYVLLIFYIITLMWISKGEQNDFFSNVVMLVGGYLWGNSITPHK